MNSDKHHLRSSCYTMFGRFAVDWSNHTDCTGSGERNAAPVRTALCRQLEWRWKGREARGGG